jgi:hypothetical protein
MSAGRVTHRPRSRSDPDSCAPNLLVVIDQEPLRARVAADCAEALARLNRARAGWHHFERKDKPAFIRWRAREFGALLSRAREVEVQICDLQALIHEVEMEMRRGFQDAYSAYERVMSRRANPSFASNGKNGTASGESANSPRRLSEFEKEALFQEWVKRSLGTHPDKMDDEAYSASFEAFKLHMFRHAPEESPQARGPSQNHNPPEPAEPEDDEPSTVDSRVKELYRRLVRRLHPDLRADGSTEVSALWHEVQEAYAASDVARMEILLAVSDIESRRVHDQTFSQMQIVLAELHRARGALEKSLLEAEREDAWDFARVGPSPELRLRVESQLKFDLAGRIRRLDLLSRTTAEWAQGRVVNPKIQFG